MLPVYQVRESESRAAELLIEPDAEVGPNPTSVSPEAIRR
jgi:hypothetical protein